MNFLPIIVGTIINMIIGSLWYSPLLFANTWMKAIGKTKEELKSVNMFTMYGPTTLLAFIMSYMLMEFITLLHITSPYQGMLLGELLWFGFVVPTTAPDYIFSKRPFKLYAINVGYPLLVLTLTGALFSVWH